MKAFQATSRPRQHVRCAAVPSKRIHVFRSGRDEANSGTIIEVLPRMLLSAAVAATLAVASPALAISGGKGGTSGSYTPLDDADLSSRNLRDQAYTKGSLRRAKFDGSDLAGVSFFGALCKDCTFVGSNLSGADLESADLEGANFTDAVLEGALVTNAQFRKNVIANSDWTDVTLRKDQLLYLCSIAEGTNPMTGVDTRESLMCPAKK